MGGRETTGEKHLNQQNKCFDFNSCYFAEQLRSREASQQAETFVLTFQLTCGQLQTAARLSRFTIHRQHNHTLACCFHPQITFVTSCRKIAGMHRMSRHSVAMARTADGGQEGIYDT